jgi:thymidylate synthase
LNSHFQIEDMGESYAQILRTVRDQGAYVAPRGKPTTELLNTTIELLDPRRGAAIACGRKLHMGMAAAEALQLVGGFSDPPAMAQVSAGHVAFQDGGVFHAAYGVRINPQVPQALSRLRQDPDTRQAVIAIWDPTQDLWTTRTRDYPCTTHLQLMIRRGRLDLHVSMRANDAWRGFPYDVFQFTQLQCSVANVLGLTPGTYYHHATSFHLYEENLSGVDELTVGKSHLVNGVGYGLHDWDLVQDRARDLFYGNTQPLDAGETTMYNALRKSGVTGAW